MEVDSALDTIGVRLEKPPLVCGECMREMVQVNPKTLRCPGCGCQFKEK